MAGASTEACGKLTVLFGVIVVMRIVHWIRTGLQILSVDSRMVAPIGHTGQTRLEIRIISLPFLRHALRHRNSTPQTNVPLVPYALQSRLPRRLPLPPPHLRPEEVLEAASQDRLWQPMTPMIRSAPGVLDNLNISLERSRFAMFSPSRTWKPPPLLLKKWSSLINSTQLR